MIPTVGKLLAGGLAFALVLSLYTAHPHPTDPRHAQIVSCEIAIKARLADPDSAQMPNYLATPAAFTHGENNAFEPIETFEFRAKNEYGAMTQYGGYCAYNEAGRLMAADIE